MVKRCGQCFYGEPYGNKSRCRRFPPQVEVFPGHLELFTFPQVDPLLDWCGEWKDKHMVVGETPSAVPTTRKRGKGK